MPHGHIKREAFRREKPRDGATCSPPRAKTRVAGGRLPRAGTGELPRVALTQRTHASNPPKAKKKPGQLEDDELSAPPLAAVQASGVPSQSQRMSSLISSTGSRPRWPASSS